MQSLGDFLSFQLFISPYVLIACYYLGAVAVPIASWFFAAWVKRRYWMVSDIYESGKTAITGITRTRDRILLGLMFIIGFICMEIMWRMMFEFMLAYLQIRDALIDLSAR